MIDCRLTLDPLQLHQPPMLCQQMQVRLITTLPDSNTYHDIIHSPLTSDSCYVMCWTVQLLKPADVLVSWQEA